MVGNSPAPRCGYRVWPTARQPRGAGARLGGPAHNVRGAAALERLTSGRLDEAEIAAVRERFAALRQARRAVPEARERRLAEELWEKRLPPRPDALTVQRCRPYFKTAALDELLAAKGLPSE